MAGYRILIDTVGIGGKLLVRKAAGGGAAGQST